MQNISTSSLHLAKSPLDKFANKKLNLQEKKKQPAQIVLYI